MRPILIDDLDICTRALLDVDQADRTDRMRRILWQADVADRYRKRLRRLHRYGDGSLKSAVLQNGPVATPAQCDANYCRTLVSVLTEIADWRMGHSRS